MADNQFNPEDIYSMSDEEILNLDPNTLSTPTPTEETVVEETTEPELPIEEPIAEEGDVEVNGEGTQEASQSEAEGEASESAEPFTDSKTKPVTKEDKVVEDTETKPVETTGDSDTQAKIDAYNKIMGEFKANGTAMRVESPEDAIQLMQMGANYRQKMLDLKPVRKIHKVLEDNGLLSEDKLGYAIDLINHKPEAIARLIKESNIDSYNLPEDVSGYAPVTPTVSDNVIDVNDIIADMQRTPVGTRVVNELTKWDEASQIKITNEVNLLNVLKQHAESGIYDQVMNVVNRERAMGRLLGVTDFEAYDLVGAELHRQGVFNPVQVTPTPAPVPPAPVAVKTVAPVSKTNPARKAAASPSTTPAESKDATNYLAMSDAEFEKFEKLRLK